MKINPPRVAMKKIHWQGQELEVLPDTPFVIWKVINTSPREESDFRLWGMEHWDEEIQCTYHPFVQDEMIKQKRLKMTMGDI